MRISSIAVHAEKLIRKLKLMNKILEETFAQQKPDPAFEQRILAGFRNRVPQRSGLVKLLVDLMRLRATQIAAIAAVLLGLVQIGRMITGEPATAPRARERYAGRQFAAQPSQSPASRAAQSGTLAKSDEVAAGRPRDLALKAPPPPPPTSQSYFVKRQSGCRTVAPAKAAQAETSENDSVLLAGRPPTPKKLAQPQ